MPTFREDPAAYMRARRAKQKAEREAASQTAPRSSDREARPREAIPIGRKLLPQEKMWDAQLDAIDAKGGAAEWTGNGYREAAPRPPLAPRRAQGPRGRDLAVYNSLGLTPANGGPLCVGGKPGPGLIFQGPGYPLPPDQAAVSTYTHAKQFEANATASINLLAREVASLKREVAELKEAAVPVEPEALPGAVDMFFDAPWWFKGLVVVASVGGMAALVRSGVLHA
jgi:hypothetical protein